MSAPERTAAWLWDRRLLLGALCALVTVLALWQAGKVGVDNSLRIWFLDDDPHLIAYRSYQERFGNDEVVIVAFERAEGMSSGAGLELLRRAEQAIAAVDGVSGVLSIAGYADRAAERGRLISADDTTAALVVRLQPADDSRRDRVLGGIERALAKLGEPHHIAGIGVLFVALNRLSMVDSLGLFCGAIGVMFVLLCFVYRRLAPAAITLGVALLAVAWTMGLYGAAGRSLNMVTSAMPTVILVVGVAEMVHLLLYAAGLHGLRSRRAKAVAVVAHMLRPCALNIVTSAVGFAALATSPLPAVRDLGVFTAAGLLGCLVLTMLGALLALGHERCEPCAGGHPWLVKGAATLCELGIRHPIPALLACALATVVAVAFASRVVVDTFTLEFLAADHPVRRDSAFIEAKLAPYVPMEFLVTPAGDPAAPELMPALERWQRAGERLHGVGWSRSVANAAAYEAIDPRLAADGTLRVTFSVRMQSARDVARTMRALLDEARLPEGTSVEPAGYLPLYVRMVDYVVESQVNGFTWAFLAVFGVIALAFRSIRIAALAVPSNLLPLAFILGVMGAAAIRLDAATVTIASVVLGLVVDDTVHFLHRLRMELERTADPAVALRATVAGAGHAIVTTALVMTLGFAVFAFSEIRSLVYFGLLIALAMATSVLTDLLFIPALLMLRRARQPRHAPRAL